MSIGMLGFHMGCFSPGAIVDLVDCIFAPHHDWLPNAICFIVVTLGRITIVKTIHQVIVSCWFKTKDPVGQVLYCNAGDLDVLPSIPPRHHQLDSASYLHTFGVTEGCCQTVPMVWY